MPRRQQRRLDAGSWLFLSRALDHRGGADVGLSSAQCARAVTRQALGRRDHLSAAGRDRCPQSRLQSPLAGNLARLGVLGEEGGLQSHAEPTRARSREEKGAEVVGSRQTLDRAKVRSRYAAAKQARELLAANRQKAWARPRSE